MKYIACVIPARLKSTRFPKKMLSFLRGKPLLQWVWEAASMCGHFHKVLIAVDAEETAQLVESFGAEWVMTSENHPSGTDRLIEVMNKKIVQADIWVNWQGDEPFIKKEMIDDLLQSLSDGSDIWTLKTRTSSLDALNPHIAKVVCDAEGHALYFSRSQIPFYRDEKEDQKKYIYKHVGIYAYSAKALEKIERFSPCSIEVAEQLEQLRYLFHGLKVKVHETTFDVFGIDLPEHLVKAEEYCKQLDICV